MKRILVVLALVAAGGAGILGQSRPAAPAPTVPTLSTQDYIDIEQVYAKYCQAVDAGNWDLLRSVFTPTGGLNKGTVDGLIESVKAQIASTNGGGRHWNTNLIITPTPEGAKGRVYMMVLETASNPPNIRPTGIYEDTLVKTAGGWRFDRRTLISDARPQTPAAPAK